MLAMWTHRHNHTSDEVLARPLINEIYQISVQGESIHFHQYVCRQTDKDKGIKTNRKNQSYKYYRSAVSCSACSHEITIDLSRSISWQGFGGFGPFSCREIINTASTCISRLLDLHRDSNMGLRCSFYICFWIEMAGTDELVSWQDFVSILCIRSSQPFSFKNNNKDWPERGGCYYILQSMASSFPILKWPFRIVDIAV